MLTAPLRLGASHEDTTNGPGSGLPGSGGYGKGRVWPSENMSWIIRKVPG